MARPRNLENMSFAELSQMQVRIERVKAEKQNAERVALREKLTDMAKQHGFHIRHLFDGRRKSKGIVAVKYRDPKNPENAWTGRGRPPRWLAAAMKAGKSRDDFLL